MLGCLICGNGNTVGCGAKVTTNRSSGCCLGVDGKIMASKAKDHIYYCVVINGKIGWGICLYYSVYSPPGYNPLIGEVRDTGESNLSAASDVKGITRGRSI